MEGFGNQDPSNIRNIPQFGESTKTNESLEFTDIEQEEVKALEQIIISCLNLEPEELRIDVEIHSDRN